LRGFLLDTNVVSSLAASSGAPSVKAWASRVDENRLYLSVITLAEYDKGIAQLPDADPNRARYSARRDALVERFAGRILTVSNAVTRRWGEISGRVKRDTGHPPGVIDTLLAATSIEAQLYLATRNVKDVIHSGAAIFNPWNDDAEEFPLLPEGPLHKPAFR
jgi:predicted nucleic acid-binding protein